MNREYYLGQAKQVIAEAERQIREGTSPCSECKHVRARFLLEDERCRHPIVILAIRNKNMSNSKDDFIDLTKHQRSRNGMFDGPVLCGPRGELFEPKEKSLIKRFLNWVFDS